MSKHLPMEVRVPIEADNPAIVRNEAKCIRCGQCKAVCTDFIGVHGTYALQNTGDTAVCIHCGQCANVCPPASITERYEWPAVKAAAADPGKVVIFSTSPSVRVALGEEFGLPDGSFVEGKMVALLRALGADYVLDTNFSADLTILEEASELLSRVTKGTGPLPQFTSCCPAWVKYAETYHPELLPHISTAKSPIGMQGPTIKTYFAQRMGIDPAAIVNVAVTPCTAKKFEIRRGEMNAAARYLGLDGLRDMDQVITTRELALWAREAGIDFASLPDSPYDTLMGEGSGAGVIFGNTGGVMEAALRTAVETLTGQPVEPVEFTDVRGTKGVKEASYEVAGMTLRVCVVSGTANAGRVLDMVRKGEAQYDFIEIMACPGGCVNGGGQPIQPAPVRNFTDIKALRAKALYDQDAASGLRRSHENPLVKKVYAEYLGEPGGEKAHHILHTTYQKREKLY